MPEVECKAAFFATGNNLKLVKDSIRRTLLCSLDSLVERPELRDFAFDPVERVLADRGKYVAAIITIIRAYRAAGSPKVCGSLGSYQKWSEMVRAPLMWLGEADPVKSNETVREEDPELTAIREVFSYWEQTLGINSTCTAHQLIQTACHKEQSPDGQDMYAFVQPEFRDVLLRVAGDGGAVSSKRLGWWLSGINGRVVDGKRIDMKHDPKHGNRFFLHKATDGGVAPPPPKDPPF